jgi:hypothetical protein
MPNRCSNNIVVTGPVEDIAHFTETCIRPDENGNPCFDFNSLVPPILMLVLGRDDLASFFPFLKEQMTYWEVPNPEALKEMIGLEAFEKARQCIEAFEQTDARNWHVWAAENWCTKWNAYDFEVVREEPGRYECRFSTGWSPPEAMYVKLAEMFPKLCFEIGGGDFELNFEFRATVRDGKFSIQYGDPCREGFGVPLWFAETYGKDPKRFLCVGSCRAVAYDHCNSAKDPECEKGVVVAFARGDTREESENSCRDIIARNQSCIKTLITDWQFTVYAPENHEHAPPEALGVSPAISDDFSF